MTDTSAQLGIVYLDDFGTPIRRRFSAAEITPPTPATDADVPAANKVDVFHIVVDTAGKKRGVYAGSFTITEKTVMEFIAELESDPLLRAKRDRTTSFSLRNGYGRPRQKWRKTLKDTKHEPRSARTACPTSQAK